MSRYFNFDKEKFKLEKFREKARKFYDKNQILCSKLNRSQSFTTLVLFLGYLLPFGMSPLFPKYTFQFL